MAIDILFPFYGDIAMMKAAVRSVLGQRSHDWKLTVVDGGYPDESVPVGSFPSTTTASPTIAMRETWAPTAIIENV